MNEASTRYKDRHRNFGSYSQQEFYREMMGRFIATNPCREVELNRQQKCILPTEEELNMKLTARIGLASRGIKRITFLYDNGKTYTAGAIKNVDFNEQDIEGQELIEYSSATQGITRVYKGDLAAIEVIYYNDTRVIQPLQSGVVVRTTMHMQGKSEKQSKVKAESNKAAAALEAFERMSRFKSQ